MSKEDRCQVNEVYVFGFVPSYLLPKKPLVSLDHLMEPFIRDIVEGFLNGKFYLLSFFLESVLNLCTFCFGLGIQVNHAVPICGMPAGPAILRHLVLCCSDDHMGLCEVGKFVKCGKKGCRRCDTTSNFILIFLEVKEVAAQFMDLMYI